MHDETDAVFETAIRLAYDAGRLLRSRIKECRGFSPGAASCDDQRGRDGKDRRASPHSFVGQPGRHRHGMVLSPSVL